MSLNNNFLLNYSDWFARSAHTVYLVLQQEKSKLTTRVNTLRVTGVGTFLSCKIVSIFKGYTVAMVPFCIKEMIFTIIFV